MVEAECPKCKRWHECSWDGIGWWWKEWPCECGYDPLVETECRFRGKDAPDLPEESYRNPEKACVSRRAARRGEE